VLASGADVIKVYASGGRAFKAGVPVALGSNAGVTAHGKNLSELPLLVRAGLPPMQALVAATSNGARLLGMSEKYGTVHTAREPK